MIQDVVLFFFNLTTDDDDDDDVVAHQFLLGSGQNYEKATRKIFPFPGSWGSQPKKEKKEKLFQ